MGKKDRQKFYSILGTQQKKVKQQKQKKKSNSNSLDNNNTYNNLNNSDAHIFIKKELGYLYVQLNKKN